MVKREASGIDALLIFSSLATCHPDILLRSNGFIQASGTFVCRFNWNRVRPVNLNAYWGFFSVVTNYALWRASETLPAVKNEKSITLRNKEPKYTIEENKQKLGGIPNAFIRNQTIAWHAGRNNFRGQISDQN